MHVDAEPERRHRHAGRHLARIQDGEAPSDGIGLAAVASYGGGDAPNAETVRRTRQRLAKRHAQRAVGLQPAGKRQGKAVPEIMDDRYRAGRAKLPVRHVVQDGGDGRRVVRGMKIAAGINGKPDRLGGSPPPESRNACDPQFPYRHHGFAWPDVEILELIPCVRVEVHFEHRPLTPLCGIAGLAPGVAVLYGQRTRAGGRSWRLNDNFRNATEWSRPGKADASQPDEGLHLRRAQSSVRINEEPRSADFRRRRHVEDRLAY